MFKFLCSQIHQNKNMLMTTSVGIYILALFAVFSGKTVLFASVLTLILLFAAIKDLFPKKVIIVWAFLFYFGIANTSLRIKNIDELLNLAPINSTIYGKIVSIPQTKDNNKVQFFFNVDKIEYDSIIKNIGNDKTKEKVLVNLQTDEQLKIYDSYKIRGRLSKPFKSTNPSQFDYGNYLRNFGTYAVFYGRNPYLMKDLNIPCYEKTGEKPTKIESFLQTINNYREHILEIHSNFLKSPNFEILGGIVFGDDAVSPPKDIKQSFINSGLLHILAASGMNVAFIYSFFFIILRFLRVPFRFNIGICIAAVLIYVFMTGLGASVVRAALMLLFVLIGKLINRDAHSIALLSFVALLMLIYNPMYINDVGFQLSFVVTFGLLLMTPYLFMSKNKIINWLIGSVTIPIIAQLWVIPIQIFYFNNISIYSIFANIMSVPILSVISFGGFISSLLLIVQPFAMYICKIFDFILNPLITLLVNISDFWGTLPNATLQTTHPTPFQIFIYYLILTNIILFFNKSFREKYINKMKLSILLLIVVLLISTINISDKNLEITAFNVGNADAFMIKTPANKYILIDTGKAGYNGGKSQAEMLILKYFADNGIKSVDSIIITHFDNDHCGGAFDLINKLNVKRVYVNTKQHPSDIAKSIYKIAKEKGTDIIDAENNQIVSSDSDILVRNFIIKDIAGIDDNQSSIVSLLEYKDFSMLFTGDAGINTLNKLKPNLPKNITILKVGHHGASGVINKSLLEYFNPQYSIISTGENKFGHPSIYTLRILKKSKILRTDKDNAIKIIVKTNGYKILTYNDKNKRFQVKN